MAPDSHRVRLLLLGSTMAGRRPLGLILRNFSSFGFSISIWSVVGQNTFLEGARSHGINSPACTER